VVIGQPTILADQRYAAGKTRWQHGIKSARRFDIVEY
jgi:hypothetical protein